MIEPAVLADVRWAARRVSRSLRSSSLSREDIEQDLLLHIVERAPNYDQRIASERTFARVVIRHAVASMGLRMKAQKRDYRCCTNSLDETFASGAADHIARGGTTCGDNLRGACNPGCHCSVEALHLRVDLLALVERLPRDLRGLCHALVAEDRLADVAQKLGISRATLHRRLRQLRSELALAGFGQYHRRHAGPTTSGVGSRQRTRTPKRGTAMSNGGGV